MRHWRDENKEREKICALTDAALFFGVEGTPLHHQRRVVERYGVVAAEVAPLLVRGVGEGAAREATRLVAQSLALALARCELQLIHRDDRVVLTRMVSAVGQCCNIHITFFT